LAAYASPAYVAGAILFPVSAVIPTFYAKHAGISLAVVGAVLTAGRLFDAVTDPLIGYMSDITNSRLGRRKPWILAGFLLAMFAVYFLYAPSEDVGISYFVTWYFLIFLSFTMIDIPHRAWGTEISRHYDERSRISTFLGTALQLGGLTFAIIPLVPIFASQGYNAETLKFIAIYFVCIIPVIAFASVKFGPDSQPVATERPTVKSAFKSVKQNKPFLYFLLVFVVGGLGNGVFYGLAYLFIDHYMQIGHLFPYILMIDALVTTLSLPLWLKVIYRFGKHRSWAAGNVLGSLVMLCFLLLEPGAESFVPIAILAALRAMFTASYYTLPTAVLGDVIDYDILKTHVNRSANYFAVCALITKVNSALGGGIGFMIIGAIGYTLTEVNTDFANSAFVATALVLPAVLYIAAGALIWFFPIDHRRHSIIRRRIESLAERAERSGNLAL
jgi:Na+/melibiose symporter-like transporter